MKELKNLPSEVISDILSRLPIESLMQCKSVCKSWFNLIEDDPLLVELQLARSKNRLPRLILWESECADELLLLDRDKERKDMWMARDIALEYTWKYGDEEKKLDFDIIGSCNGLLCMASSFTYGCCSMFHGIFICNPITKECVMLPVGSAPYFNDGDQIGFGVDSTGKYKVIHILTKRDLDVVDDHVMKDEIITLGESSWREIEIPYRPVEEILYVNGALYCIIQKPNTLQPFILAFHLNDEKFCTIDFPPSIHFPLNEVTHPLHLAEFKGSLAMYHLVDRSSVIPRWFMQIDKSKGNKFYQCDPINVAVTLPDIFEYFRLVGMLSINLLVYKVVDNECYDSHLLVYCLEKKQFMCDRVSGVSPKLFFKGSSFVPSLVSPIAIACGKAKKDNMRSRFRGLYLEVVGYSSFWELMDSFRLHPTFISGCFSCRPHCKRRNGRNNGKGETQSISITTNIHPEPPSILNQTFTLLDIKTSVVEFTSTGFLES